MREFMRKALEELLDMLEMEIQRRKESGDDVTSLEERVRQAREKLKDGAA